MNNTALKKLSFHLSTGGSPTCRSCAANGRQPATTALAVRFLAPALFEVALREALPLGLQAVTLTGSEPLAHPNFDQLLDQLASQSLAITLETTGSGLSVARAEQLAQRNCQVMFHLHAADTRTHEEISGVCGSFETIAQAMEKLAAAGLQPHLIFVLTRQNAAQISDMVTMAENFDAASVHFHFIPPRSSCAGQALMVEELIALGRRIDREIIPHTRLPVLYDQPLAFRGLNPQSIAEPQVSCNVLSSLTILEGGQLTLCDANHAHPELTVGQVGVESLQEIWREHPILQFLRDNLPDQLQGVCGRCLFKASCLGHCIAQNYASNGSFLGPYWFCADAEQAGLFPASRLLENTVR